MSSLESVGCGIIHGGCSVLNDFESLQKRLAELESENDELRGQLQFNEKRFDQIAAHIPEAIFRYTLFADGTDSIDAISQGAEVLYELPVSEIERDSNVIWSQILPEFVPGVQASVLKSAEELSIWNHRWEIELGSGVRKWVHGLGTPSHGPDGSTTWNTIVRDVTDEVNASKDLEIQRDRLHRAQKMESLGQLTSGIAHDFNNLLAIVLSVLELLALEPDGDDREELLRDAMSACARGGALTRRLLSFARRVDLHPEKLSIADFIHELQPILSRPLHANIELRLNIQGDLPPVMVDPSALENALLNLVINGRDAMARGGTLSIDVESVELKQHTKLVSGRYLKLAVSDTGSGISEDMLEKIFNPFFSTKEHGKGSGLGLSLIHSFMEQSGGSILVDSQVGVGSTFSLLFPFSEHGELVQIKDHVVLKDGQAHHILLVEDEDKLRSMLRRQIESVGHRVTEASNSSQALNMLNESRFDLLITDVEMPGQVQGLDLVRRLLNAHPHMAVVILSGNPPAEAWELSKKTPHVSVLLKPAPINEVLIAISNSLEAVNASCAADSRLDL